MKKIPGKIKKFFIIFLKIFLAIFLLGIIHRCFIVPWVFGVYILFYGGNAASFVFAVWLGIYAGNDCKHRWFFPVVGILVYFCLLFLAFLTYTSFAKMFDTLPHDDGEKEFITNIVIVILVAMVIAVLSFVIRLLSKWKIAVVIRTVLITIVIIAVTVPVGVFFNKRYCPTYYKYPDFIIREMGWDSIQKWYGTFDQMSSPSDYERWGAYYTYTDEQGNCWYYTIYYEEFGWVRDIRMEIH